MPEGGRLVIGTADVQLNAEAISEEEEQPGDFVAISVADTGEGMPLEVMARVFEPIYTTKPLGQGTALD
jgi:signal transduction histidine kinase